MASNAEKIRQLEAILDSGALEGSVDGQTVKFQSPQDIMTRIRQLQARDCTQRKRRPVIASIKLGGR